LYLRKWYQGFNVRFVVERPREMTEASYQTILISNDGAWCGHTGATHGLTRMRADCGVSRGGVALALDCAGSSLQCAALIAHEHGHLSGLEHTTDTRDVMYASDESAPSGFATQQAPTQAARCGPSQNSFDRMLSAYGAAKRL